MPPEPRLQTNPREDLRELRDAEQDTLTTYGWVDRNAGIVRIPIDEAITLTLQRGLPEPSRCLDDSDTRRTAGHVLILVSDVSRARSLRTHRK